ncbi:ABC transporter ATP-binding protein [Luteibaculum oceani]|uniref:ABC transporter ATP-binding protein n=1 Tax=Luteibaculum oceani TaxID=1294296 RepID=A0A5C6VJA2_9FLAO|nr:ABC transporter ATP-binding protein [Luteibaculum oceani]TXC85327.1 ABC transporter ATP-binding protein [Luteibaculum oceani]
MIKTQDLLFGYPQRSFGPINIAIAPGELTLLIGKNGIGKSTLIKTLLGLIPSLQGVIKINKLSLNATSLAERSQLISYVASSNPAVPHLTVKDLIGIQPLHHKLDENKIDEYLELLKISKFKNRYVDTLSDGELQKVYLARALAQSTKYIVLDEPAAHLDVNARLETFIILKKLAEKEGKGIMCSTHDLELGLKIADRIVLLTEDGAYQDIPEELALNGLLSKTFNSGEIAFNKLSGNFEFCLESHKSIRYFADNNLMEYWVVNALRRKGINCIKVEKGEEALLISENELVLNTKKYTSIEDLINNL